MKILVEQHLGVSRTGMVVPAGLEQASLARVGFDVICALVTATTVLASALTHPKPEQEHKHMAQRIAASDAVVHTEAAELITIKRERIMLGIAGLGLGDLEHRHITTLELTDTSGIG